MSLIPNRMIAVLAAGIGGALLLGGCQLQQHVPPPEPLNPTPIATDPAMQTRLWTPSPAYYINDSVVTFPDYAPLQSKPLPYHLTLVTEPLLFGANMFYIPVGVFVEPAWKEQIFKALSAPPSFTLMPPLPPGPEPTP